MLSNSAEDLLRDLMEDKYTVEEEEEFMFDNHEDVKYLDISMDLSHINDHKKLDGEHSDDEAIPVVIPYINNSESRKHLTDNSRLKKTHHERPRDEYSDDGVIPLLIPPLINNAFSNGHLTDTNDVNKPKDHKDKSSKKHHRKSLQYSDDLTDIIFIIAMYVLCNMAIACNNQYLL